VECVHTCLVVVTAGGWWQFEHRFFVVVCVTVGMTELVTDVTLDVGLCWRLELLGRGMLDDEIELELEIVPLRGACQLDNEELGSTELDVVKVVLKTGLLELTLELELEDGLGLGDGLGDGPGDELELNEGLGLGDRVGLGLEEELELDVTVVENWTWLIGEEKDEVVVTVVEVVVVAGNAREEDEIPELDGEELDELEVVVVVPVVVLVVVVVVLVVTS
jgi:hypothetical protein